MHEITLFKPHVSELAKRNVLEVLSSGQLAEGPRAAAFEASFSATYGIRAVALNSGSSALDLAYQLIGIGPGDEVIVPVLGHPANALPVLHRGGKIVLCDVLDTLTADPLSILKKAAECTRLKAIIYVHFGGSAASLRECKEVADKLGVPLIEDAAQCGPTDSYGVGDYTCFSLQAIKLLTAGDGGMLSCKDPEKMRRARRLRWFGFDRSVPADARDIEEPGFKYHMNDVTAAIAHGNLETIFEDVFEPRNRIAHLYRNSKLPILQYSWLTILVHPKALQAQKVLRDNGIGCGQQHFRMDLLKIFGGERQHLKNMNRLESQYLMLPFHHEIKAADVDRITEYVRSAIS